MIATTAMGLTEAIEQAISALNSNKCEQGIRHMNEFVCLPGFLSEAVISASLLPCNSHNA